MKPTELVYSSHERCDYLHRTWIVHRALDSWDNKTLLYLPISSGGESDQQYSWGTFAGYLDGFRPHGLNPSTFIWKESLTRGDAEVFFARLRDSEVVILGGGRTTTGYDRYRDMGGRFFGNPEAFRETLFDRRKRGKLTVGYSAGADHLCQYSGDDSMPCFGLLRNVVCTLHFDRAGEGHLQHLARRHPDCLVFGLPNDSGIAVNEGLTPRGTFWQHIEFVLDNSWDRPEDHHHIKTRQGVKIEHRYADGRDWKFNGGDTLLRVFHADGMSQEAWIKRPELPTFLGYMSQRDTGKRTVEEILWDR